MYTVLFSLILFSGIFYPTNSPLIVEITNVQASEGSIRVALYKPSEKFGTMGAKPDFAKIVEVKKAVTHRVEFTVAPGTYAIAMYHDVNGNEKLDKNLVGYPKEPFGFSNNFRPIFSGPKFKDCSFAHSDQGTSVSVKLIH